MNVNTLPKPIINYICSFLICGLEPEGVAPGQIRAAGRALLNVRLTGKSLTASNSPLFKENLNIVLKNRLEIFKNLHDFVCEYKKPFQFLNVKVVLKDSTSYTQGICELFCKTLQLEGIDLDAYDDRDDDDNWPFSKCFEKVSQPLAVLQDQEAYKKNVKFLLEICPSVINCTTTFNGYLAPPLFIACCHHFAGENTINLLLKNGAEVNPNLFIDKDLVQFVNKEKDLSFDDEQDFGKPMLTVLKKCSENGPSYFFGSIYVIEEHQKSLLYDENVFHNVDLN